MMNVKELKVDFKISPTSNMLGLILILKSLNCNVYLVGGCVRDFLLNKKVKDFDFVIDGNIEDLIPMLLENGFTVNEAGKRFLVLIASKDGEQYEIAMFRKDGTYVDGRRPEFVEVGDIHTDSIRRDLSVNSLYYDINKMVILDPTGKGLDDISNRLLRFNGKAKDRITEDYLRIMRVYRFSKTLGFEIDKNTLTLCRRYFSDMVQSIPPERIRLEIEKMVL